MNVKALVKANVTQRTQRSQRLFGQIREPALSLERAKEIPGATPALSLRPGELFLGVKFRKSSSLTRHTLAEQSSPACLFFFSRVRGIEGEENSAGYLPAALRFEAFRGFISFTTSLLFSFTMCVAILQLRLDHFVDGSGLAVQ